MMPSSERRTKAHGDTSAAYNVVVAKREYGTGHVYEKWGSYYGRWRTVDGRLLNRRIGPVRSPGETDGLTRTQAERQFRRMQQEEESSPRPIRGAPARGPRSSVHLL